MYQNQGGISLADIMLAAQQIRANERQSRLQEMQMQAMERQQQGAEIGADLAANPSLLQEAQQYAAQGRPEMLRTLQASPEAIQAIQQQQRQQQIMNLREQASQSVEPQAIQQQAQIIGMPPEVAGANKDELRQQFMKKVVDARTRLGTIAPEDPWLKSYLEQERKDYSPDLVEASNAFGLTPSQGLHDPEVQAYMKSLNTAKKGGKTPQEAASILRREFQNLGTIKNVNLTAEMYEKIKNTSETAAGDISLIYAYMKMVDPGSAVKENEYSVAQNASSLPERLQNAYYNIKSGVKLETNREMFRQESRKLLDAQLARFNSIATNYRRLAVQAGVSPDDVVLSDMDVYKARKSKTPPKDLAKQPSSGSTQILDIAKEAMQQGASVEDVVNNLIQNGDVTPQEGMLLQQQLEVGE